jgi:hypothetical protein
LTKPERRYCVTRKELLAVVFFVKHFKHYLYGKQFIVRTGHGSLGWLLNFKSQSSTSKRDGSLFSINFLRQDSSNGFITCISVKYKFLRKIWMKRPIAFASRTLTKPERHYCVTQKELLAVVFFVKHFKHYLYGKQFIVRTDHGSLCDRFSVFSQFGSNPHCLHGMRLSASVFRCCLPGRCTIVIS